MKIVKKIIKCNLPIDGVSVSSIEELKKHITLELVDLYNRGLLQKWLEQRDADKYEQLIQIDNNQDTRAIFIDIINVVGDISLNEQEIDDLFAKLRQTELHGNSSDSLPNNESISSEFIPTEIDKSYFFDESFDMKQNNNDDSNVTRDLLTEIEIQLERSNIDKESKKKIFENIAKIRKEKLNMLIVGATGSGKSTTINALFNLEVAKVGYGTDPETMDIHKYELQNNLILWDTPGLGDSPEKDSQHIKKITTKLQEKDCDGNALIDLVLVIIDGSSRDMGTSYDLINYTIIPNMKEKDRIIIAINQCDIAMKGKGWDHAANRPNPELDKFLRDKAKSVNDRIYASTQVLVESMYYSAEQKYNISKLLYFILQYTPENKRIVYASNVNKQKNNWKYNDDDHNYNDENRQTLGGTVTRIAVGAISGAAIGSFVPVIGTLVGGAVGAVCSFFSSFF